MLLSRSLRNKLVATSAGAVTIVALYQVSTIDSQHAARQALLREESAEPAPGTHLVFQATAYCKGTVTKSGVAPRTGIAAADPELLPVGSVVQVGTSGEKYTGIYTIMDTGPAVRGREIDIYMWSCVEALAFGRQRVHLTVLRLGWNPRATSPGFIEVLLQGRVAPRPGTRRPPLPARPLTSREPATLTTPPPTQSIR